MAIENARAVVAIFSALAYAYFAKTTCMWLQSHD